MTTILLTGSSRGIGAAIADTLSAANATVIGHGTASGIAADFADPAAPAALWQAALARAGGAIDVLVNNAGVFEANPIDVDDAEWLAAWERTQRINLTAAAQLSRHAVRHWQGSGGGRILSSSEVHDWKRYQTRIMSSANQANLDFEDAAPQLVAGLTRAIAGIF